MPAAGSGGRAWVNCCTARVQAPSPWGASRGLGSWACCGRPLRLGPSEPLTPLGLGDQALQGRALRAGSRAVHQACTPAQPGRPQDRCFIRPRACLISPSPRASQNLGLPCLDSKLDSEPLMIRLPQLSVQRVCSALPASQIGCPASPPHPTLAPTPCLLGPLRAVLGGTGDKKRWCLGLRPPSSSQLGTETIHSAH